MTKLDYVKCILQDVIETPVFMPVGTQGTVKGVFVDDLQN